MVGGGAQELALAAFRPIPGESSAWGNPSPHTQRITGTRHGQGSSSNTIKGTAPAQLQGCPQRTRAPAQGDGSTQQVTAWSGHVLVFDGCTV